MSDELNRKIHNIMAREMGSLGKFIVNKQCKDLGIDPENIKLEDIGRLADAFEKVMETFGGKDKARTVKDEIKKLGAEVPA